MNQTNTKNILMKILILNGPNLNLLGKREPSIYGNISFEDYFKDLKSNYNNVELNYFQSNVEGEIINKLHEIGFEVDGIIINAGGYTHTSIAIADAIAAIKTPVIEVHISNVYAREDFRKTNFVARNCVGSICGLGLKGYELALQFFITK
jgi:3-dehydroquinate dehydratase II